MCVSASVRSWDAMQDLATSVRSWDAMQDLATRPLICDLVWRGEVSEWLYLCSFVFLCLPLVLCGTSRSD